VWTEREGGGLRSARFRRVYRLRPSPRADRRVILWYEDGAPALVEGRHGEGRVLLFTSTLDRDWTDLPIRPGYLPLIQQMVHYLSRVAVHAPRRPIEVGTSVKVRLPESTRELRLVTPTGAERVWTQPELAAKDGAVEVPAPMPGLYRLSAAGADGVLHVLDRESFMANVNPAESDLRKASPAAEQGAGGEHRAARATRRVELWHALGALLLGLILLESFLIRRG
jgi:hypothetical protein